MNLTYLNTYLNNSCFVLLARENDRGKKNGHKIIFQCTKTKLRQYIIIKMGAYGNTNVTVSQAKDTESTEGQGDQGQSGLESQVSVLSFC